MGTREFVYTPNEYLRFGDKSIKSPPLINTSLKELAEMSWYLTVSARYVSGYSHSKLKYHFSNPDKQGYPFLVFKVWVKGSYLHSLRPNVHFDKLSPETHNPLGDINLSLVELFVKHDLTPAFTKPASFALMPLPDYAPVMGNQEPVAEKVQETELEYLTRMNEEKMKVLPRKFLKKPKGLTDEGWQFLETGTM